MRPGDEGILCYNGIRGGDTMKTLSSQEVKQALWDILEQLPL
jgi:hypothetical protein